MQPHETLAVEQVLALLGPVRRSGDNWLAKCPAHEDHRESLSVGRGDSGAVLLKCFAGCTFDDIAAALHQPREAFFPERQTKPRDLFKALLGTTYDYKDADGVLRYQVCRMVPKDFRQRRPDPVQPGRWIWDMKGVARIPYRLNELRGHDTVYLVEGEKDADALAKIGLCATTNVGGAGKWKDTDSDALHAIGVKRLVLLPDNDKSGRTHVDLVAKSVKAVGIAVVNLALAGLPPKGDVSDWLALGHTRAELEALVGKALWVVPPAHPPIIAPPPDPADDPNRWNQSDLGSAEAFVHRDGDALRFDHLQERWLVWNGHVWRPDGDSVIYRRAHEHIRKWQVEAQAHVVEKQEREQLAGFLFKLERRAAIENIIAISRTLKPVSDPGDHWDLNPWLLGVSNGIVDLHTGVLRDGRRDDQVTIQTGTRFDASADCPRWQQFLGEVFDGDALLIDYVQRALGYSLTGDMREQCFFMCVGAGSNGKSTFTTTLDHVWGDYGYTTDMKTFTTNQNAAEQGFDLAELATRRLVLASETKSDSRLNEQALKNFTGGEKMNAQRKYGHPFEYLPTGKIWMGLNHQPRVKDDSYGFWRRVRILPFTRTFGGSTNNNNLRAELRAEASGILAWAVQGCLAWQTLGLQPPPSVYAATDSYQESEDPLNDFVAERIEIDPDFYTSSAKIYAGYREWAREQGLSEREALTATSFGRLFSRRFERRHTALGKRYMTVRLKFTDKDLLS